MTGGNTTEETSEVPQFTIYIASMPGQYTVSKLHVYLYLQSTVWPVYHIVFKCFPRNAIDIVQVDTH